jgi:hypothetical protein
MFRNELLMFPTDFTASDIFNLSVIFSKHCVDTAAYHWVPVQFPRCMNVTYLTETLMIL